MKNVFARAGYSLISLGLLVCSVSAQAAADPALVQKLIAHVQAKGGVKTLRRPILTYHWGRRNSLGLPDAGNIDPRSPSVRGSLQSQERSFFQFGGSTNTVGNGLYLAIDPISSVSFGGLGRDWAVVQMYMPPNVRYLDAADAEVNTLPVELIQDLKAQNCMTFQLDRIFGQSFSNQACQDIKIALVRALGVSAMRYDYISSKLPGCDDRPNVAFLVFDDRAVDWNSLVTFTQELPNDDLAENRILIESMFSLTPIPVSRLRAAGFPWPQIAGVPPRRTDMNRWIADNFMSCGTQHPEENLADLPVVH